MKADRASGCTFYNAGKIGGRYVQPACVEQVVVMFLVIVYQQLLEIAENLICSFDTDRSMLSIPAEDIGYL